MGIRVFDRLHFTFFLLVVLLCLIYLLSSSAVVFVTKGVVNTIIVRNMSMEQERKHRVLVTRRVPKAGIEILRASQR